MSLSRSTLVASFAGVLGCTVERAETASPQAVEIAPPVPTRVPDRDVEQAAARSSAPVPAAAEPPRPECLRTSDASEGACGAESACGGEVSAPCRTPVPRI